MFDPSLVVQSAASSFNNVAISAPTFFWGALLMLPLFAIVYKFGNAFIEGLPWTGLKNPKTRTFNFAFCVELIIFAWLILMSGNWAVLRDSASNLPYVISGVLFIVTASMVQKLKTIDPSMPAFMGKIKHKRLAIWGALLVISALAGFAGGPGVWGFAMGFAAVFCGALVGRGFKKGISPILLTSVVMFIITVIMLMQSEFFRFGQLGNLTVLHILFLLVVAVLVAAIIAVRNINPRGRVHHSAYVKLKWLARFITIFCLILFILTESVPVFLGMFVVLLCSFAGSVWHMQSVPENLSKKLWAILLGAFGIMTGLPLITSLGIIYWVNLPKSNVWKAARPLL